MGGVLFVGVFCMMRALLFGGLHEPVVLETLF